MKALRINKRNIDNKKGKTISGSAFLQGHQFKHSL